MIVAANSENIARAAELVLGGEVVAFPTETVYGLGANAFDATAIDKIYQIKGRPANNPLIVHLPSVSEIHLVADLEANPTIVERLALLESFWPGPLTVILPKLQVIPDIVTAGRASVAVRIPSHPIAQALLQRAAVPIAAPSANRSSYISATSANHVAKDFGDNVALILDGGDSPIGIESTVISIIEAVPIIYRHGYVTKSELEHALGMAIDELAQGSGVALPSPGMLAQHYSPNTPLKLIESVDFGSLPNRVALIQITPSSLTKTQHLFSEIRVLSAAGNLNEAARRLYSTLRELDCGGFDLIVVEGKLDNQLGRALKDRLTRAQLPIG